MENTALKNYCNCLAQQRGLDPIGNAHAFQDAVVIELPLPWKRNMTQEAGQLPQEIIDLMGLWLQRYHAGEGYPHSSLVVAPDKAYSQPGYRRVMFYTRPEGMMTAFNKVEYLVPETELGPLVWSLYEARDELHRFDVYRIPGADSIRDIMVCTHGTIDAACAKFGYPLYQHIRGTYGSDDTRIWRVSHFGGHVFAPTLMDMPIGHYWAYVEENQARQIVERSGDVSAMRGYYRGWSGLSTSFLQAAERELWQQHGWDWFSYPKSGKVLTQDSDDHDEATQSDVEICYTLPDNPEQQSAIFQVEIHKRIETEYSTASDKTYAYPQYQVKELQLASAQ